MGAGALLVMSGWVFARANVLQPLVRTEQAVVCLERSTGDVLWKTEVFETSSAFLDTFRTMANVEGDAVVAICVAAELRSPTAQR